MAECCSVVSGISSAMLFSSLPALHLPLRGLKISTNRQDYAAASAQLRKKSRSGIGNSITTPRSFPSPLPLPLRMQRSNRVKAGEKLESEEEESTEEKQMKKTKNSRTSSSVEEKGGLVDKIEAELGRQFGGLLWYSVLLLCLALFGGGYVYLIFNYADFSDIPILRGPQG